MSPAPADPCAAADPRSAPDAAPSVSPRRPLKVLFWLALAAAVLLAVYLSGGNVRALVERCIVALRAAGPGWFFTAMAVLPAFGFPLLPFTLAAGPAFGPTLGVVAVAAWAIAAVAADTLLGYWLADRALRPLVQRVLARFGYRVPVLPAGTAWQAVVLVRLAPGLPFCVQSYVLGLMRVPWLPYAVMSTAIPACYLVGVIVGGDALWHGQMKVALFAFAGVGVVAAGIQLWRKFRAPAPAATSR